MMIKLYAYIVQVGSDNNIKDKNGNSNVTTQNNFANPHSDSDVN